MKSDKLFILCINQKNFLKKHTITYINTIVKMDTIFMSSENSKTSKSRVLILKLTHKLDLRRGEKSVALSNVSIY